MAKLHPGVYIQEVPSGIRPIEGVGTSIAAFIGVTEKGLVDHALMVRSFAEFQEKFGNFLKESWLPYSALQFFNNGGTRLYIVRVTGHQSKTPQEIDYQKAFSLLDPIIDINLVAVPGIGSPSMVSYGADYCRKRQDCFFIGDMSLSDNTVEKAKIFIDNIAIKSSHAAVYFPWLDMVIWGARTLATQSDTEFRYVPVRRTAIYIAESIEKGTKWVVFEPNDEQLWAKVRINVGAFMTTLFRAGAFQGSTERQACFVRCDRETTTLNDINLGNVNFQVGFAPLKPAEFIINFSQKTGQLQT